MCNIIDRCHHGGWITIIIAVLTPPCAARHVAALCARAEGEWWGSNDSRVFHPLQGMCLISLLKWILCAFCSQALFRDVAMVSVCVCERERVCLCTCLY